MGRLKRCFMKECENDETTGLVFVTVPAQPHRRAKWLKAALHPATTRVLYCCEDHFDFEHDAENWLYFREAGRSLKLKPDVVPRSFIIPSRYESGERSQMPSSARKRKRILNSKLVEMSRCLEDTMEVDDDMQMDEDPVPAELPMSTDEEEEAVGVEKISDDVMASPVIPVDVDIVEDPKAVGLLEMEAEALGTQEADIGKANRSTLEDDISATEVITSTSALIHEAGVSVENNAEASKELEANEPACSFTEEEQDSAAKDVSSTSEDSRNNDAGVDVDPLQQTGSKSMTDVELDLPPDDQALTEEDSRDSSNTTIASSSKDQDDSSSSKQPKSLAMELSEVCTMADQASSSESIEAADETEARSASASETDGVQANPMLDHISIDGSSISADGDVQDHVSLDSDSDSDDSPVATSGKKSEVSQPEEPDIRAKSTEDNEVTSSAAEVQATLAESNPLTNESLEPQVMSAVSLSTGSSSARGQTSREGIVEASSSDEISAVVVLDDDTCQSKASATKPIEAQITLIGKPSDSETITSDKPVLDKSASAASIQLPSVVTTVSEPSSLSTASESQSMSMNESTSPKSLYSLKKILPSLAKCLHCSGIQLCPWKVELANKAYHLCSEKCLEAHRLQRRQIIENGAPPICNAVQMADLSLLQKKCAMCSTVIQKTNVSLTWEVMDFCNENCLNKYQLTYTSKCSNCKADVSTSSMGKYSVRFGHEVKQFCSPPCLDFYKKSIKTCSYCQKNLQDSPDGFLAAVGGKDQFRDFCSQGCLEKYNCICNNTTGSYSVATCVVCENDKVALYELLIGDQVAKLCTDICLAAYKFVNKIEVGVCGMCNKYYDTKSVDEHVTFLNNTTVTYCSKHCLNISVISKRKIVPCSWCKAKKYNFDMIYRRGTSNNDGLYVCSINCLALHDVSMNAIPPTQVICAMCKKLEVSTYHITMSDATVRHFCCYDCVLAFQAPFNTPLVNSNQPFPASAPKKISKATETLIVPSSSSLVSTNGGGPTISTIGTLKAQPLIQPSGTPLSSKLKNLKMADFFSLKPLDMRNKWTQITTRTPSCQNCKSPTKEKGVQHTENVDDTSKDDQPADKGSKEATKIFIPVPVPIYVPYPAAMYTLPSPVLFPVPVPFVVPVIIPTSLDNTEQIIDKMKEIFKNSANASTTLPDSQTSKTCSDGEKSQDVSDYSSVELDDGVRRSGKRKTRSGDGEISGDEDQEPPKKVRFSSNNASVDPSVSAKRKRLKYMLGVDAWKYFVKRWNASLDAEKESDSRHEPLKVDLLSMSSEELNDALTLFVKESKRPNGLKYRPDCTFYLCLGIQYYLFENEKKEEIFCDEIFANFTDALDDNARSFHSGIFREPFSVKSPISRVEEEHLWESAQLGAKSPQLLLMTLMYFFTLYFKLWTVEEHLQLTTECFSVVRYDDESRTRKKIRVKIDGDDKTEPRECELNENETDGERCPVRFFEFYLSKCPKGAKTENDPLYLMPISNCDPNSSVWYMSMPLPPRHIEKMINRVKMIKEVCDAINQSTTAASGK